MFVPVPCRWLLILGFVAVLIVLSLTPGRSVDDDSLFSWVVMATPMPLQKLLHVLMYALLAFLLAWAMEHVESRLFRYAATLIGPIALGAMLEGLQTLIPGRFGTLVDVLLNGAGAAIGLLMALLLL